MFYTFQENHLHNFIVYEDTLVPFDNQGLVIVQGSFNGAGKSLLFSSLPLVLQGHLPTGKMKVADSKPFRVGIKAKANKDAYDIQLEKNKYKISKNNREVTPYRKPDALQYIQSVFPEESLFNSTTFVSQASTLYATLINGTPALRTKVIESFIDLSKVDALREKVRKRYKSLEDTLSQRNEIAYRLQIAEENLKSFPVNPHNGCTQNRNKLSKLKHQYATLDKEIQAAYAAESRFKEYQEAKQKLKTNKSSTEIATRIAHIQERIHYIEQIFYKVSTCKDAIYLWLQQPKIKPYSFHINYTLPLVDVIKVIPEEKAKKIIAEYDKHIEELALLRKHIDKLNRLEGHTKCPLCDSILDPATLSQIRTTLEKNTTVCMKTIKALSPDISLIYSWYCLGNSLKQSNLTVKELELYKHRGEHKLRADIQDYQDELAFLQQQQYYVNIMETHEKPVRIEDPQALIDKRDKLRVSIDDLQEAVMEQSKAIEQYDYYKTELKEATAALHTIDKGSKEDKKFALLYTKTLESRDFRTEITYSFCESLVNQWNVYANDLFEGRFEFLIGRESGYPAFLYSQNGSNPCDIRFLSGGEKKRLIACMIPSILNLSTTTTNILVVDELDANVNQSGVEAILEFLPCLLQEGTGKNSIFFITPRKDLSHTNYNTWFVERNGDRSSLIY